MAAAGADQYTFHIEAVPSRESPDDVIRKIKEAGMKVSSSHYFDLQVWPVQCTSHVISLECCVH